MTALRDYDLALVTKLGATLGTTPPALPGYTVAVDGMAAPVKLGFDLPEDWWEGFDLPGIAILRTGIVPTLERRLPGFVGQELSTNPSFPNTYNVQAQPSQPVELQYQIQLAAESVTHMNAMLTHVLFALPTSGYGTSLSLYGSVVPFRSMGFRNVTQTDTKGGRFLRWVLSYAVEGWLAPLDCIRVPQILDGLIALEQHPTGASFTPPVADPPLDPEMITEITFD